MFCEVFSKVFFESLPEEGDRPLGPLLRKAGQKTRRLARRQPAKHMHCNSMSRITASFPKAGAKVRLIGGTANLLGLFFRIFACNLCKLLIYKYVLQQVFEGRGKGDKNRIHYSIHARVYNARYNYNYSSHYGKKLGRKRKQCFERRKTMLSRNKNNAFHSSNG